jgi:hypothetical protein
MQRGGYYAFLAQKHLLPGSKPRSAREARKRQRRRAERAARTTRSSAAPPAQ